MMFQKLLFQGRRAGARYRAAALIALIAFVDWRIIGQVPLGFLYLVPMLMIGRAERRSGIFLSALLCTCLAERFGDLEWNFRTGISRDVLYFAAFFGAGLFVREVVKNQSAATENLHQIERERDARRDAEEQLQILIESNPMAIMTADAAGTVLMANQAAHRMLGVPQGGLAGRQIQQYLPSLSNMTIAGISMQMLRAVMQAHGVREDGESFLADICFSTYRTSEGVRLTAMVLDISEDLRAHEVSGLQQLLDGSRIAVGALCHEIRNLCGAVAAVHRNLKQAPSIVSNKDFEALGSLLAALERIANVNLQQSTNQATEVDLAVLLDELKIVVAPSLQEEGIISHWRIEPDLPLVIADRSSLMQVFLNLVSNSTRALAKRDHRELSLSARVEHGKVLVRVSDSGGGVAQPENLFRPFQGAAESTGLGLYLSRAFMRSFGGELHHSALPGGACFSVELLLAKEAIKDSLWMKSAS